MRKTLQRTAALWMLLALMLSLVHFAPTAEATQHYSTSANSGTRGEICTALSDGAVDYYTGQYTYDTLSTQTGTTLLQSLRNLMTDTHSYHSSYNDCRDLASKTDCQNEDGTISLLYTSYVATVDNYAGGGSIGWNREHVWPKSLGGFSTTGAGADLHHIRPDDYNTNGKRGNRKYGNVSGGTAAKATIPGANGAIGGYYNSNYFEPIDSAKGDVARICLYVYVRYGSEYSKCSQITNVFQSVDVLLEWCALDPVDTWEMGRNEVVEAIQGNRNVFIDYPELAWKLFGKEVPADLTTPSGSSGESTCTHVHTEIKNNESASCTDSGYTGDTYCTDCGEKLATGSVINASGHKDDNADTICDTCGASLGCAHSHTEVRDDKAANCAENGYTGDLYCTDCSKKLESGSVIIATGEHAYGEWAVEKQPTTSEQGIRTHTCTQCGHKETENIPLLPPYTDNPSIITLVIILVSVVAGVAVATTVTVIVIRKKRRS